ncbi:PfkB family carbohydrate kinase [Nocardioides dubius]|uniref:PfkB family carbohydrate kinase n=1 Tax=Nocardioides dubius TaxID=317019 RepID=UPI0031D7B12C
MRDTEWADAALVVGESVLDVVRVPDAAPSSRPGGSAVNTAVALARLGRSTRLATCYADDAGGREIVRHLAGAGVALAGDPHVVASTARADAVIDASGAAHYEITVDWRLPVLSGLLSALSSSAAGTGPRVVHVTSFAPLLAPGAAQVLELVQRLRPHCAVSYDVNLRPAVTGAGPEVVAAVQRMAAMADLVKASDEDLAALWPTDGVEGGVWRLLAAGAAAVVVTRGAAGASWHTRAAGTSGAGSVAGVPVVVVDTIGAGDTFSAALIDRLWPHLGAGAGPRLAGLEAEQWRAALAFAVRAAAVTVSRHGADPPSADEL